MMQYCKIKSLVYSSHFVIRYCEFFYSLRHGVGTFATGTSFLFDDVTEYQNGHTNSNASTFQVKSNRPWAVTVKAAAATFTGPAAPATQMPSTVCCRRDNIRPDNPKEVLQLISTGSIMNTQTGKYEPCYWTGMQPINRLSGK